MVRHYVVGILGGMTLVSLGYVVGIRDEKKECQVIQAELAGNAARLQSQIYAFREVIPEVIELSRLRNGVVELPDPSGVMNEYQITITSRSTRVSNYWTRALYIINPDGKVEKIGQLFDSKGLIASPPHCNIFDQPTRNSCQ